MIKPKKPKKGRSIGEMCPELIGQWHPSKNGELTPFDVNGGSAFIAWWKCPKGDDHIWPSSIKNRKKGQGCGICTGKVVVNSNCLETNFPDIAKEWHPTKNAPLTPKTITMHSGRKVWWKCKEGDEFKTSVAHRTIDNTKCPFCTNQKVRENGNNSHQAIYPKSAIEWDINKNFPVLPSKITPSARKKYWWICQKCNFNYTQSPYQRTNGPKCRKCGIESTKEKLKQGEKFIKKAKEICKENNYKYEGLIGEYQNVESKFKFTCNEGHKKKVTFHGFVLSLSKCSDCAEYGWKDSKPAILYINYHKEMNALKFGKTNQLDGNRLGMQNRKMKDKPKWIEKYKTLILTGTKVTEIENRIKQELKQELKFLSKEEMPDGYTETAEFTKENLDARMSIIEKELMNK